MIYSARLIQDGTCMCLRLRVENLYLPYYHCPLIDEGDSAGTKRSERGRTSPKQLVGSVYMTEDKTQLAAGDSAGTKRSERGRTSPKQLVGSVYMTEDKTQLAAGDSAGGEKQNRLSKNIRQPVFIWKLNRYYTVLIIVCSLSGPSEIILIGTPTSFSMKRT